MTAMTQGLVHFIHGKESGPWGGKITALAGVAKERGWDVASLDYSHTTDPRTRLDQLLDACAAVRCPLLLVGSSMGGWVAAQAAMRTAAHGVFLLAPAVYVPGYPSQAPDVPRGRTEIVHGWHDEMIPWENAIRFARLRQCTLHLIPGDHRLNDRLPLLCELFNTFLGRCGAGDQAKRSPGAQA
jgi:alpha/beta superfamily hydrolase